jgi:uncharacterized protein (TIGR03437 family)
VEDLVLVAGSPGPSLAAPGKQFARIGTPLSFEVAGSDASDGPVQLTASDLPAGAYFDWAKGRFEWTPTAAQAGRHRVAFTATDLARRAAAAVVEIDVAPGVPELAGELRCSPGAIGTLEGKWLTSAEQPESEWSGTALELGGTRVRIGDRSVPVLFASRTRVSFVCPLMPPGTELRATVEAGESASAPVNSTMLAATPEIQRLPTAGAQGMVTFAGSDWKTAVRRFDAGGQPAQPGDSIVIWATGLGRTEDMQVSVKIGGVAAELQSLTAVANRPGTYAVQVRIPAASLGDAVPVTLEVAMPAGRAVSDPVTIALEAASQ